MNDLTQTVNPSSLAPTTPALLLAVAESMARLHGRATIRLRVPWGRGLLTIDDTDDGLVYTETWRDGYRYDWTELTREQAIALLEEEQG